MEQFIDNLPSMDLMRSEKMTFVQLIIPVESAHRAISYLGELGLLQFRDLSSVRTSRNDVNAALRDSMYIQMLMNSTSNSGHSGFWFYLWLTNFITQLNADKSPFQRTFVNQVKRCAEMSRKLRFFKDQISKAGLLSSSRTVLEPDIDLEDLEMQLAEHEHELIEMNSNSDKLRQSYNELLEFKIVLQQVSSRLTDLEATLEAGIRHRNKALASVVDHLAKWMNMVRREKAVYDTLNMLNFDVTKKCLVGEGWCPLLAKTQMQEALQRATFDSNSQVGIIFHPLEAVESPPTYFRTNTFTNPYQEIVDAYGVARYQEANPAVYTTIIFPFLFALMFGDWGHGICLLLGALVLIARENKLSTQKLGSFMEMLFGGRYVLLLMALFSIYCGLIYNEFFSVPFHIFGASAYKCRDSSCRDAHTIGLVKYQDPYPFGVDPSWRGSRSELPFLNSLKMKMSILFGVAHMNLGIILSYFNARFFGSSLDIRYQFVPQIIFLNSLFGYLSLLIVIKWCTGSQADLYHVMIYMFLSPTDNLGENQLFWGQKPLQIVLLLLAVIAVPWMLFPKPFILKKLHTERFQGRNYGLLNTSEVDIEAEPDSARQHHHEEFNFSEVFVHQMIHAIEFVLGSVSNTASYLRLWALSLAHSELSTVFYEKVLLLAWGYDNLVIRLVGLTVFSFATAFILLMMESLSAFLHALRLHWVEFQNKFYHGDGYKFRPFSFASLTEDDD
ncbi:hypothetical protein ACSQ67_010856 [Phaseolus vulgaris]